MYKADSIFLACFAANANNYFYRQCTNILFIMQGQKVQNASHLSFTKNNTGMRHTNLFSQSVLSEESYLLCIEGFLIYFFCVYAAMLHPFYTVAVYFSVRSTLIGYRVPVICILNE